MTNQVVARPWTVLASRMSFEDRWIRLRTDDVRTAAGQTIADFHVLEYPDWINVVPVLDDGRLLMVREYRHGVGQVVLGLVGGGVERADGPDGAEAAARRELLEETGYAAATMTRVLTTFANAASQTNRVTAFVAQGLERRGEPAFEPGEEIELVKMTGRELLAEIREGRSTLQAMHVAAIFAALDAGLIQAS
jgi:ADP-ribose pyrophosphatase